MSYFWIIIYILFVLFILTIFFWSTIILQQQKKAWQTFAKKHGLLLHKGGFFETHTVEGNYKKNKINLFSQEKIDESSRGMVKYRTAMEIVFDYGFPGTGALGNIGAMRVVEVLNFGPTFHPENSDWNESHLVTASNRDFIKAYLTPKRMEKLNTFFNMPNAVVMMVFNNDDTFLRVETTDPMTEPAKIEKFFDKLVALIDDLKLTEKERKKWAPSKTS